MSLQRILLLAMVVFPLRCVAAQVYLRANQLGYVPAAPKIGMAFSTAAVPGNFTVIATNSQRVCYTGQTVQVQPRWGLFEHHAELDFSLLRRPGTYILCVGTNTSLPFTIGERAYAGLAPELLGFMRQQRCGYNPWLEAACHQLDGRTAYGPNQGTLIDARGGWHDAADLLKYLLTSGNATAQLLLAYQLGRQVSHHEGLGVFEDKFDSVGHARPNGIADVLDEARWGLDWMLKLHPAPDQLYHQVADDRDHIGRRLPQNEIADYGWGKGGARVVYFADGHPQGLGAYKSESTGVANLAGRYAAAMALASQIWGKDPRLGGFSKRCLQAGKEVYELGRAQEGVQQGNSVRAPYRYEERTWADDMEWGAAELFRATREPKYLEDAKRYAGLAADISWMGKEQTAHYEFYPFMNIGHFRLYPLVDKSTRQSLAGYYRSGLERCREAGDKNPYGAGAPFVWCSNNLLVALATQCLLYERMTGDRSYRLFACQQRDWLLGRNPWGFTMFSGIGSVFPRHPHLMTAEITGRPVAGGLVDGPVYQWIFSNLRGVSITEPDPLSAFQGPAVYHDDAQDYSSNEPTMDGTASAVLFFALCSSQKP